MRRNLPFHIALCVLLTLSACVSPIRYPLRNKQLSQALKHELKVRFGPGVTDMLRIMVLDDKGMICGALHTQRDVDILAKLLKDARFKKVVNAVHVAPESSILRRNRDFLIKARIRSTLVMTEDINSSRYKIHVWGGIIYILGNAATHKEGVRVCEMARCIPLNKKVIAYIYPDHV